MKELLQRSVVRSITSLFLIGMLLRGDIGVAQSTVENSVAANGVNVEITTDKFSGKKQYLSPNIPFEEGSFQTEYVRVGRVEYQGSFLPTLIYASMIEFGDDPWILRAILRGGENVRVIYGKRDKNTCMRTCSYNQIYRFELTNKQVSKYKSDGIISIRLESENEKHIINIPSSFIEAVEQVTNRK